MASKMVGIPRCGDPLPHHQGRDKHDTRNQQDTGSLLLFLEYLERAGRRHHDTIILHIGPIWSQFGNADRARKDLGCRKPIGLPFFSRRLRVEPIREFRYARRASENTAPTRSLGFVGGNLCVTRHGLHDTECAHDHRRACLLPHDAQSVRANGHVRIPWLLPKGAADQLRCSDHKGRLSPLGCGCNSDEPAGCFRVAEPVLFFDGMGGTSRLFAAAITAFDHFRSENLVRSILSSLAGS